MRRFYYVIFLVLCYLFLFPTLELKAYNRTYFNNDQPFLIMEGRSSYESKNGRYIVLSSDNTFEKQIIGKVNTIFEIRDVFDLKTNIIKMPADCILVFRGGALKNGTIVGNNTIIESPNYQIFSDNCKVNGTFRNTTFNADWFKDIQSAVDVATNNSGIIQLSAKVYVLKETLYLKKGVSLIGCGNEGAYRDHRGTTISYSGNGPVVALSGTKDNPIKNVTIKNLKIRGNGRDFSSGTNVGIYIGPKSYYCQFENITLYACSNGIEMDNAWNLRFESVNPYYCKNGFFLNNNTGAPLTTTLFSTCVAYNSVVGFNMSADMSAVTFESCGTDGCATSMELSGCFGVSVISYEFEKHTKYGIHLNNSDCYVSFVGLCPRGLGSQTATLIKIDKVGGVSFSDMYISDAVVPKEGLTIDVNSNSTSKVTFINSKIKGISKNLEACHLINCR